MMQAFVITFREGLEAFLIVALSLAYLRRQGRGDLVSAVHWGIAAGVAASLAGGVLLHRAANQEMLEGPLALVAAISVAVLTAQMWRAGRRMRAEIEERLTQSIERRGGALFGVFLFTLLMIGREGMETVLLLVQISGMAPLVAGGLLGVAAAAIVGAAWSRYGSRVPLGLFFQVTALFLFVFVIQLSITAVHEMAEQHLLPYSLSIHDATEAWGPDGPFGHMLTYLMVLLPAGWLLVGKLRGQTQAPPSHGSRPETAVGR
jgi:high-affinity iron transporter